MMCNRGTLPRLVLPYSSHDKVDKTCQKSVAHYENDREIHCDSFPTLRPWESAKHGPDEIRRASFRASMSKRQACIDICSRDLVLKIT